MKYVPEDMPFGWVKKYQVASLNTEYKARVRTGGEMVSVLIDGNNEAELLGRIRFASTWLNENLQ